MFCGGHTCQDLADAVWARYTADDTSLDKFPSPAEQGAFLRSLDMDELSEVLHWMMDKGNHQALIGMVPGKEVADSGFCGKLQEIQPICNVDGVAVLTTAIVGTWIACDGAEARSKNTKLPQ